MSDTPTKGILKGLASPSSNSSRVAFSPSGSEKSGGDFKIDTNLSPKEGYDDVRGGGDSEFSESRKSFENSQREGSFDEDSEGDVPKKKAMPVPAKSRRFTMKSNPSLHNYQVEEETRNDDILGSELSGKLEDMLSSISNVRGFTIQADEEEDDVNNPDRIVKSNRVSITERLPNEMRVKPEDQKITEGWLNKKGGGAGLGSLTSRRNWKTRYFRMDYDHTLRYFESDKTMANPKGEIILKDTSSVVVPDSGGHKSPKVKFEFEIHVGGKSSYTSTAERIWYLSADDQDTRDKWIYTVRAHIAAMQSAKGPRIVEVPVSLGELNNQRRDEAWSCEGHGPGLADAIEGQQAEFTIITNDELGNPLDHGGKLFHASLANEHLHYDLVVNDLDDGTYNVKYICKTAGDYTLNVLLAHDDESDEKNGFHIAGSPFFVTVKPDKSSAPQCVAAGESLSRCEIDRVEYFVIYTRTQWDKPNYIGGDDFIVTFEGPGDCLDIVDNNNGTYTVAYKVSVTPEFLSVRGLPRIQMNVMLHDGKGMKVLLHNDDIDAEKKYAQAPRHIKGSPFMPTVYHADSSGTRGGPPPTTPLHPEAMRTQRQPETSNISSSPIAVTSTIPSIPLNLSYSSPSPTSYSNIATNTRVTPNSYTLPTPSLTGGNNSDLYNRNNNATAPLERGVVLDPVKIRSALESKQRAIEDEYTKLVEMRKQLENDRKLVDKQMAKISQIGHRVEEDSEKLVQQAKLLGIAEPKINISMDLKGRTTTTTRSSNATGSTASSALKRAGTTSGGSPPSTRSKAPATSSSQKGVSLNDSGESFGSSGSGRVRKSPTRKAPTVPAVSSGPSELGITIKSSDLFDDQVSELFDKNNDNLYIVFSTYGTRGKKADDTFMSASQFAKLLVDFEVAYQFVTKSDIRNIVDVSMTKKPSHPDGLLWGEFVEALARCAIVSLSNKKGLDHLYPTNASKVGVLLEMWGLADTSKLREVQAKNKAASK